MLPGKLVSNFVTMSTQMSYVCSHSPHLSLECFSSRITSPIRRLRLVRKFRK